MNFSRSLPWLIAAAALAGGLGLYLGQRHFDPTHAQASSAKTALVYPKARPLGDFLLERVDGRPLTLADWKGQWNLVFIGFTHCPDACPQALAVLRDVEKRWPADGAPAPALYFVSVDPERDTAKVLSDYARYFSPNIIAATGTHDRLEPFTRQLGMIYMKSPQENGDYTVDHSTDLAVIGPDGTMVALFRSPLVADAIVDDLIALRADLDDNR